MGFVSKVVVLGAAVAFAKSEQGKQLIAEARERFDTPANREKARQGVSQAAGLVRDQLAARKATG